MSDKYLEALSRSEEKIVLNNMQIRNLQEKAVLLESVIKNKDKEIEAYRDMLRSIGAKIDISDGEVVKGFRLGREQDIAEITRIRVFMDRQIGIKDEASQILETINNVLDKHTNIEEIQEYMGKRLFDLLVSICEDLMLDLDFIGDDPWRLKEFVANNTHYRELCELLNLKEVEG